VTESIGVFEERLHNHCLTVQRWTQAADVVSWFGAVQAQEFAAAKWALALRMAKGIQDGEIERVFNQGTFLRTHVLRSTWHFVTPADIHWMRELTAPRVRQAMTSHDRKFGITASIRGRANTVFERAFRQREFLTRTDLGSELKRAGIDAQGVRLALLTMHAEVDGVLCSGPQREGKLTYALLAARVPTAICLKSDEALAELTRRYFQSHGPATVRDFAWWSGLTVTQAKRGLEMNAAHSKAVGDGTYWTVGESNVDQGNAERVHLLPVFDEFLIAYRDRDAATKMGTRSGAVKDQNAVIVGGRMVGSWRPSYESDEFVIEVTPWRRLTGAECDGLAAAGASYGRFLDAAPPARLKFKVTAPA
jgi:hypothetical protein